uniref:Murine retrovirus integration site 1 homolog n=1 Tax=Neogobius melanostomus TaxID=47308 RepID=A0A8C6STZ7_9GOBI
GDFTQKTLGTDLAYPLLTKQRGNGTLEMILVSCQSLCVHFSDSTGNVIDLVKDTLPDMQLSEEDRKKNLELLEQAKKASDRFLTRRGRRSTSSLSPTPTPSPTSSPCASRSNSLTVSPQASEHKLMRNQSISKLPDLSEAAEQEKVFTSPASPTINSGDESKSDATPNISDNAFVQLSLAYRNDNYTLEMRLKQAERERNLTEEDTEKELEEFKNGLKMTSPQWQNMEQREAYQRLIETVEVLHRLATRLSSRAEIVGAVRQEKRMNKATEVMMQFVENLKRTYEKDHAELMEFKKLANQNSNRSYGSAVDTGG